MNNDDATNFSDKIIIELPLDALNKIMKSLSDIESDNKEIWKEIDSIKVGLNNMEKSIDAVSKNTHDCALRHRKSWFGRRSNSQ